MEPLFYIATGCVIGVVIVIGLLVGVALCIAAAKGDEQLGLKDK